MAALLVAAAAAGAGTSLAAEPQVAGDLRRLVMASPDDFDAAPDAQRFTGLHAFYQRRGFTPIWIDDDRAKPRARAVLDVLRRAPEDGLVESDYAVARIESLIDDATPAALAELELRLSAAMVRYARDMSNGRLAPQTLDPRHYAYPREIDAAALLHGLAQADDPAAVVRAPGADNAVYAGLRHALADYRRIEAAGGWPVVPPGETLEVGDQGRRIVPLRRRLEVTGDIGPASGPADVFDTAVADAVKRFQRRHGLDVDGVVGPKTYAALIVPVEVRIRQLILNMERARWMPHELGRRHILVNIAGFEAWLVEDGRPDLRLKAIVGKSYQQTPAFSDQMTYLVLNPYWNVPPSIGRRETLPAVRENPAYLADNNMEVVAGWDASDAVVDPSTIDWSTAAPGAFPYRFRQRPGPGNALGQVKFMFPNQHNVYLHDTSARELFARTVRAFSHGCVRVSDPLQLAARLLAEQPGWSRERIDQVVAGGEQVIVPLARPLPVHVSYFTAWGDGGEVNFRADVYGRDTSLENALFGTPTEVPAA